VLKGFREFVMRGNVVDLAVGVVIGAAFGKVIDSFVAAFIDPLVRLVSGGRQVSGRTRVTNDIFIDWGDFINAVITFLLTAAAIYFVIVMPINRLNERRRAGKEPEPAPEEQSDEVRLLTEIRDSLRASSPAAGPPAQRTQSEPGSQPPGSQPPRSQPPRSRPPKDGGA